MVFVCLLRSIYRPCNSFFKTFRMTELFNLYVYPDYLSVCKHRVVAKYFSDRIHFCYIL